MSLDKKDVLEHVRSALAEDVGSGDVTAALLPDTLLVQAVILSREPMLMCGQPWANAVFAEIDSNLKVHWCVAEGAWLDKPQTLCHIQGSARSMLTAERTALNFLQTLSGTATKTRTYVQRLKNSKTKLLDTRKTIPGLRLAQKYAVSCAGGMNHRFGLYDAFLVKENHIKASGSIAKAVAIARKTSQLLLLEVEVQNISELEEALMAKPDRILLDNFSIAMLREAVALNQKLGPCALEASGGIDLENIAMVAKTGIDYISVGDLTKSVEAIDLSLLIVDEYA